MVTFSIIFKINIKIEATTKKAITSYRKIFKTVTPLKIPPNLKNGKCSYKNTDNGFFKKYANIKTRKKPTVETTS